MTIIKPWVEGPLELLKHGINHLQKKTDIDNRIAMISIDNATELSIKTFLGLPKRITKLDKLSRKELDSIIGSFPSLLDGLEKYCEDKIQNIDLGDIEWFHRLRNKLYHDGNGITIESNKVVTYLEIVKQLITNLFKISMEDLDAVTSIGTEFGEIGHLIALYIKLENVLLEYAKKIGIEFTNNNSMIKILMEITNNSKNRINQSIFNDINSVRKFRNEIVHGISSYSIESISDINKLIEKIIINIDKME
jgi:hypothetical protein